MLYHVLILFLLQVINLSSADHYKGGTISWKPTNAYSLTSPIEITITERHSWTLTRYMCNQTTVNTFAAYHDIENIVGPSIACISSSATCTASSYQTINSSLYCTDYSISLDVSSGTYYTTQNLTANSTIDIAWRGAAWVSETLTNGWSLVAHIDLSIITNKINTSPGKYSLLNSYTYKRI